MVKRNLKGIFQTSLERNLVHIIGEEGLLNYVALGVALSFNVRNAIK